MTDTAKFMFDTVFEPGADGTASMPRTLSEDDLDAIRAEGYAQGYNAGQGDALAKAEQDCAAKLDAIGNSVSAALGQLAEERRKLAAEAGELAMMISRRLVPFLMKQHPSAEIEGLLADALTHLSDTPHLVIRINEGWLEQISPRLEQIAQNRGFAGRLIVLAEPDVEIGDCRIEWADGGITRNAAAVGREIEATIARHMGHKDGKPELPSQLDDRIDQVDQGDL